MDYDDLLVYLLMLLESKPHIASQLQKDHQFIMIDEYQDTNSLQHRIVKALAGKQANVMAVGDDAQSIYSFRGANHANILEFPSLFKDCALYAIEQNYRSVQPILDCANHVLQAASFGYKKELFSSLLSEEKPMIISTRNEQEQSAFIVQQILELREEGISLNAMAALVRSGYMSFDLEIELAKAQIPFRKFGGFKFIETAHVKDMLAFFRIANNPTDILAWHRLLLLLEGVGPGTASIITDEISSGKLSLMDDTGWQEIKRGKDEILRLLGLLRKMQDPALSINENFIVRFSAKNMMIVQSVGKTLKHFPLSLNAILTLRPCYPKWLSNHPLNPLKQVKNSMKMNISRFQRFIQRRVSSGIPSLSHGYWTENFHQIKR
jgi:DNA helicase-2/ATP-dependent DNA helicase PcrA